ncbi:MAG TPA: NAD(P)/FAD-dependent oxidoreductase, partial [Terriglobales bacterium]
MAYGGNTTSMTKTAIVIGSGPNGLSAAITLAQAGVQVTVYESESQPGGAARTMELTRPGFHHDFGSAVLPMAVGSPFFRSLPLGKFGLQWIYSPAALAHPLDDGTAVMLWPELEQTAVGLGRDGGAWRRTFGPLARNWFGMAPDLLGPINLLPRRPLLMALLGLRGFPPARWTANRIFKTERAKALFAGLAAHSVLSLDEPLSAAFGIMLGVTAHAVGWPVAQGGTQSLTNALIGYLESLGGSVRTNSRVGKLTDLPESDLV